MKKNKIVLFNFLLKMLDSVPKVFEGPMPRSHRTMATQRVWCSGNWSHRQQGVMGGTLIELQELQEQEGRRQWSVREQGEDELKAREFKEK